jgi:hypothetical protein
VLYCLHIVAIFCIQYSTFAKRLCKSVVLSAPFGDFLHTVQHFGASGSQKRYTVCTFSRFSADSTALSRTALLRFGLAKVLYCLHMLPIFCIQYSTLATRLRRSAILSSNYCDFVHTVQHFCDSGSLKCYTVCKCWRFCAYSIALWRCGLAEVLYCLQVLELLCIQYSTFASICEPPPVRRQPRKSDSLRLRKMLFCSVLLRLPPPPGSSEE